MLARAVEAVLPCCQDASQAAVRAESLPRVRELNFKARELAHARELQTDVPVVAEQILALLAEASAADGAQPESQRAA